MKYSSEKQIAELVVYKKTDVLIKKNCLEATLPCLHTSSFKHKTFQVLLALICRKKVLVKFENEEVHYNFFCYCHNFKVAKYNSLFELLHLQNHTHILVC